MCAVDGTEQRGNDVRFLIRLMIDDLLYLQSNYGELLKLAQQYIIVVTPDQAKAVEAKTRSQSKSPLWFRMRSGRITA